MFNTERIFTHQDSADIDLVTHFDNGSISAAGVARADGSRAFKGVVSQADSLLNYRQPDGTYRKEIVLSDQLFDRESLASLRGVPICSPHPSYGLRVREDDIRGYTGHQVGANRNATLLGVDFVIDDRDLLARVDSDDLKGLSSGYQCRPLPVRAGDLIARLDELAHTDGGWYQDPAVARTVLTRLDSQLRPDDTVILQQDRRYFHNAVVRRPRAPNAQILPVRMDSGEECWELARTDTIEDIVMPTVPVLINGTQIRVDAEDVGIAQTIESSFSVLRADMEEMEEDKKLEEEGKTDVSYKDTKGEEFKAEMKEDAAELVGAMYADMQALKGRADSVDAELEKYREAARADSHNGLVEQVATVTGAKTERLDSMSDRELYIAAIAAGTPGDRKALIQRLDTQDDAYLAARAAQVIESKADSSNQAPSDAYRNQLKIVSNVTQGQPRQDAAGITPVHKRPLSVSV